MGGRNFGTWARGGERQLAGPATAMDVAPQFSPASLQCSPIFSASPRRTAPPLQPAQLVAMRGTLIFPGTSCPALTGKICENLGMTPAEADLSQFSNGETSVRILTSVRDKDVFVVQSGSPNINDTIMELLIMISACKGGSANKITGELARPHAPAHASLLIGPLQPSSRISPTADSPRRNRIVAPSLLVCLPTCFMSPVSSMLSPSTYMPRRCRASSSAPSTISMQSL